jgi:hypothetical protein
VCEEDFRLVRLLTRTKDKKKWRTTNSSNINITTTPTMARQPSIRNRRNHASVRLGSARARIVAKARKLEKAAANVHRVHAHAKTAQSKRVAAQHLFGSRLSFFCWIMQPGTGWVWKSEKEHWPKESVKTSDAVNHLAKQRIFRRTSTHSPHTTRPIFI